MDGCMYVYIQVFVLLLPGQEYTLYNKSCSIFIYLFMTINYCIMFKFFVGKKNDVKINCAVKLSVLNSSQIWKDVLQIIDRSCEY